MGTDFLEVLKTEKLNIWLILIIGVCGQVWLSNISSSIIYKRRHSGNNLYNATSEMIMKLKKSGLKISTEKNFDHIQHNA